MKAMEARVELEWLVMNTRPVPGERAAVCESWTNALLYLGMTKREVEALLDRADARWSAK